MVHYSAPFFGKHMDPQVQYPLSNDHDALVTLIAEFNATAKQIGRAIAEDHDTTLEVRDLVQKQYTDLKLRIDSIEEDLLRINPDEVAQLKKDRDYLMMWVHDFNRTKHLAWVVASAGFILIGYYIPFFVNAVTSVMWNLLHMK